MLQYLADLLTYNVFGLQAGTGLAESVSYFIYDGVRISLMVFFVVSLIAFVRTFAAVSKLKRLMKKSSFGLGNLAASCFGALTPFCSCSSIPVFIGFLKAEIPLGVAFSFLITSPLVNEVAFVIMGGMFGWHLAVIYAVAGILLGTVAGMILGALKMENQLIFDGDLKAAGDIYLPKTFKGKIQFALNEGLKTLKKLLPYILGGIAVGAVIHGFVPHEFFEENIGKFGYFAVPFAVILGIPIYAGCSAIVPLVFSITAGGVPLGTSLAFMMSVAGLSLPEAIILKRVMTMKLLAVFFGIVGVGIMLIGFLFNWLV